MISRPTRPRDNLASAIQAAAEWQRYCDKIDAALSAREAAHLKAGGEARAEAEDALKAARQSATSPEMKALHSLLGTGRSDGPTLAQAEAALATLQDQLDATYSEISMAKREAARMRGAELAAALRQRDAAVGEVLTSEGLVRDLLGHYHATRVELGRLYCALAALPVGVRPSGLWETSISLGELQNGDRSLAETIHKRVGGVDGEISSSGPPFR